MLYRELVQDQETDRYDWITYFQNLSTPRKEADILLSTRSSIHTKN